MKELFPCLIFSFAFFEMKILFFVYYLEITLFDARLLRWSHKYKEAVRKKHPTTLRKTFVEKKFFLKVLLIKFAIISLISSIKGGDFQQAKITKSPSYPREPFIDFVFSRHRSR